MSSQNDPKHYFDDLYRDSDDPWKIRSRWYERRKRALTLASLPREHFHRAFEPACGNGELTIELAACCDELIAADISEDAVSLTRERVAAFKHVAVEQMVLPDAWPEGQLDLIVLSEVGYYLNESQLNRVIERMRDSLSDDGAIVACHWRKPIEGWTSNGDEVHATLRGRMQMPLLGHYWDDDLMLDVWTCDARSVHQRETER
jgi:cyclopropane fatty-acyl-phospholipid synthase-like methyltransferase